MATYYLGDSVTLEFVVRDADGVVADATNFTVTVTLPDGTTATPSVSHTGLGTYAAAYTPTVAGRFLATGLATGQNAAAYTDTFTVVDVGKLLITPTDLDVTDTETAWQVCEAATAAVVGYIGRPVMAGTFTSTVPVSADIVDRDVTGPDGVVGVVELPAQPVTSVTTVVVDGVALTAAEWDWDTSRNRLLIDDADAYEATVTYRAGLASAPAQLMLVAKRLALSMLSNPGGVTSERLADYSVTYGDADFSKLEQRILDRYRPSVGTIRPT